MQCRLRCLLPSAGSFKKLIHAATRGWSESKAGEKCAVFIFVRLPLIKSQISVSKLCQQSPLQDLFGCLVLDEVDDDVLQPVVILRSHVFLSESQQAGILQLYGLDRHRATQMT